MLRILELMEEKPEEVKGQGDRPAKEGLSNWESPPRDGLPERHRPTSIATRTPWGIPIPDGWDVDDPVFQRHPAQCTCFRNGVLRCGVPCIWAWPPGAKPGNKVLEGGRGNG